MVVDAIGHLAEAAFRHPDLTVSFVIIKLKNRAAKGVTNKDFALARNMEDRIQWPPAKEDGPVEGTPDDPRFKFAPGSSRRDPRPPADQRRLRRRPERGRFIAHLPHSRRSCPSLLC